MNTRFSKSMLVLAVVSLLAAGSALAGNGSGECNGTGDGTCTSAGGSGNGSGNGGPNAERGGSPLQKAARLDRVLGLDDGQETAVLDFLQNQEASRQQLREDIWSMFGRQICEQREANEGAFHAFLLSILNDDQLAIHQEMLANREAKRANNRQKRGGNGGLDCSQFDE
jgi:hypothetical protein